MHSLCVWTLRYRISLAIMIAMNTALLCLPEAIARSPHQRDFFVQDAARIIEGLDITDRDRQRVIITLLEDYDRDWTRAHYRFIEGQQLALEISTPEYRAARAALDEARKQSQETRQNYKVTRSSNSSVSDLEAAREKRQAAQQTLDRASYVLATTERMDPATNTATHTQMRMDRAALAEHIQDCLEVILTKEELQRWPDVQSDLARRRALAGDTLAGEGLHLEDFINQLSPSLDQAQSKAAQPVIDRWKVDIDQRLKTRDFAAGNELLQEMTDEGDPETTRKIVNALQARLQGQRAVRDTTYAAVESIAQALDQVAASRIRHHYQTMVYKALLRETVLEHAVKKLITEKATAAEIADLESLLASHQAWRKAQLSDRIDAYRNYQGVEVIVNRTRSDRNSAPKAHAADKIQRQLQEEQAQRILMDWATLKKIVGRTRAKEARGNRQLPQITSQNQ